MQVWTVANQKGGVAKTTTAIALGGYASEAGKRVLLIDIDPQGSMTSYFRQDPDSLSLSVFTLFKEHKKLTLELVSSLILPTSQPLMSLLPSSTLLATLERQSIGNDGLGLVLQKTIAHLKDEYDRVIIDCPPALGVLLINALVACDRLIIPVQTEFLAFKGLERMLHTLQMLSRSQKKQLDYVIVPTLYDKRTHASVTTLRKLRFDYGTSTWPGKIPVDTKLRDASKAGIAPQEFAPESHGIVAYKSLYSWLEKHDDQARYWRNQRHS